MTTIEQLRRKANQHWELAGLARLERDFADEARHMGLARELERKIREMKVFGEAEVADEERLAERVAELEKALAEVRRRARNIWGACSSDQIIDKDVERQAKLMLEYIDATLEAAACARAENNRRK